MTGEVPPSVNLGRLTADLRSLGLVRSRHIALANPDRSDGAPGQVATQPLYVPQLVMADGLPHDVVFLATTLNDVFAVDPDSGGIYWHLNVHPAPSAFASLPIRFGVHATPVISPDLSAIYVAFNDLQGSYVAALNLTTGQVESQVAVSARGRAA